MTPKLQSKLLDKAKEAFILAIEIYNKPTIKYRVESFSFLICNAWELMLKAHLLERDGDNSIYFKDNPSRTLSLETCVKKVFTNEKSPIHRNLMKIIELRNTSTHFITEEYEMVYIPLFQASVLNFVEKMQDFHSIDMTEIIPQNFLALAVSMKTLDENIIRAKYPEELVEKLLTTKHTLDPMIEENNQGFAIKIEHLHYITKNKHEATSFVHIASHAETGVKIIKEIQDPNNTHKFSMKNAIKEIDKRLRKEEIDFKMNAHRFNLFNVYYGIKENPRLCYIHKQYSQPTYSYSMQAIEFIVNEIKKDPINIIENLKKTKK